MLTFETTCLVSKQISNTWQNMNLENLGPFMDMWDRLFVLPVGMGRMLNLNVGEVNSR